LTPLLRPTRIDKPIARPTNQTPSTSSSAFLRALDASALSLRHSSTHSRQPLRPPTTISICNDNICLSSAFACPSSGPSPIRNTPSSTSDWPCTNNPFISSPLPFRRIEHLPNKTFTNICMKTSKIIRVAGPAMEVIFKRSSRSRRVLWHSQSWLCGLPHSKGRSTRTW